MSESVRELQECYRILVLGNQCVGKTTIVNQLCYKEFVKGYRPTVENAHRHKLEIGGQLYDLEVVDTAGLDEYSFIPPDYCGDKYDGYVFVYAINNQESFNIVKVIKEKLEKQRGVNLVNSRKAVVLVGNKNDLEGEREVTQAQGKATALSWNIPSSSFLEVSAKERNTITSVFGQVIQDIETLLNGDQEKKKACILQ